MIPSSQPQETSHITPTLEPVATGATVPAPPDPLEALRIVRVGLVLSIVTILYGFAIGGVLGGVEDAVKDHLRATAEANLAVYAGDEALLESTLGRAFTYMKRAHMHGGGIGTAVLAIVLVLAFLRNTPVRLLGALATALGVGGLGYSVYWMVAGLRAPALGGTGPAKESLAWLAVPSAGLLLVGVVAALVLLIQALFFGSTSTSDRAGASGPTAP